MSAVVVCLHSGGLSARQWKRLRERLAPTHATLAPELLGYTDLDRWPDDQVFHFRQDLDHVLHAIGELPSVDLVGHSYGGFLACHVALALGPARVRRMVVYEPVTFGVLDRGRDADELATLDLSHVWDPEAWPRAFVDWWQGAGTWDALPAPSTRAFRAIGKKLYWEVMSLLDDPTHTELAAITAPTLVLSGSRTRSVEHRTCERLAALLPHATYERIEGAGHMGPITHQAVVDARIAAFLESE